MEIKIDQEFKKLIPPLSVEEYEQLEKNILEEGCRDALVVWNEFILDGHNRFEICRKHNLGFDIYEMDFESRDDAMDWMDKNQLGRRNLTPDQRRIIIGRRYNREKKAAHGREDRTFSGDQNDTPKTADRIAKETGSSAPSVKRYARDAEFFDTLQTEKPELAQSVWSGEKTLKDVKGEEKKKQRTELIQEIKTKIEAEEIEKPSGLFDVIVIDPPWSYGREYDPNTSRVANPYPEMNQEQLKELQLPSKENSILFLWTTHAFIWDAKELLDHWGFTYKANLVWNKEVMGMGAWFRMQCEFCLVGIKGKPLFNNTVYRDIITEKRREHSRKPDGFYKMVEEITVGRKIDFFSRENREGWYAYGAESGKLG